MRTVPVARDGAPPYEVRVGPGLLAGLARELGRWPRALLVSDENVAPLYAERTGLRCARCVVPAGERSKRFAELERVLDACAAAGLDRSGAVVALGGGVVGDLAGLAAALYMRGIACVQAPTSLVAQVDSSVGGKTAVDLEAGKNLAGAFHPPSLVVADTAALATLPDEEYRSGLGEVLKTAIVAGEADLAALERSLAAIAARDADALEDLVVRCVAAKAAVVARDPREAGERKVLNLGHTFAHAVERAAGYGAVPHGAAVAAGVVLALRAARAHGLLADPDLPRRAERIAAALGLPDGLRALRSRYQVELAPDALLAAIAHDKKSRAGAPRLVLPEAAGRVRWDVELAESELRALLERDGAPASRG